eukprot:scaffold132508_cov21-Tisochrysis_lutea.AAC.1
MGLLEGAGEQQQGLLCVPLTAVVRSMGWPPSVTHACSTDSENGKLCLLHWSLQRLGSENNAYLVAACILAEIRALVYACMRAQVPVLTTKCYLVSTLLAVLACTRTCAGPRPHTAFLVVQLTAIHP